MRIKNTAPDPMSAFDQVVRHSAGIPAESGLGKLEFRRGKSVRFGEKRTISPRLANLNRKTSALPSEAAFRLILVKRSANDPKRTSNLVVTISGNLVAEILKWKKFSNLITKLPA